MPDFRFWPFALILGSMDTPAIQTAKLGRTYKLSRKQRRAESADKPVTERVALADVSLEIRAGELFGLLGPNGAGKTTLIKILATLLAPSSGSAWVDGLDVVTETAAIRPRINMVSGGESCGYGLLTVRENLWLFSQLYGVPTAEARRRIDAMLAVVGLADRADTKISQLSTGLRQKMNFCRGFITDPKILFLDEPTLGLDVNAARAIRQFVLTWITEHRERTLLLTTHYMTEADELCDRVAIIDGGKVLACDTPAALKQRVQRYPIFEMALSPGANGWQEIGKVPGVHQCTATAGPTSVELKVALEEEEAVGTVVQKVLAGGARILTLKKVMATLEDVFIELVGHGLGDDEEQE
jgi:ABC-2 type transport system ATP-binding protein